MFMRDHVADFPVNVMCEVLGVSRSGYYTWASRAESARAAADRALAAEIRAAHAASRGRYGSPRVHAELRARGRRVGRKRVARLMRGMGLAARRRRRFRRTTDSSHVFPIAPNLLGRNFTAEAPDRVWLADLTYIWTTEGWLYFAAVLDLCTRRVVGWAMADHLGHELARAALDMAIARQRPLPGLIHHADRGVQFAAHRYRARLLAHGMLCSMSRTGDCWRECARIRTVADSRGGQCGPHRWPFRSHVQPTLPSSGRVARTARKAAPNPSSRRESAASCGPNSRAAAVMRGK
jgi:hypothetical protein